MQKYRMTPKHIVGLATSGETETLEFEEPTGIRRASATIPCAFLNRGCARGRPGVTVGWAQNAAGGQTREC